MVLEVLSTLVTSITYTIRLFEKIATTYAWLKKVASTKWKEELDKYIKYLRVVKEVTTPYETSNCSKTVITGALKLVDEELKESWSKVDEWMLTTRFYKQLMVDDFINQMKSSRVTIDQNLQLFSTAVQTYREQEKKEFEEKEKEKERKRKENEYKDWLAKEKEKEREAYENGIVIFCGIAGLVVITKWTVIFFGIIAWLASFFGIACLVVITKWTVIFFRIIAKWTEIFSGIACLIAFSYVMLRRCYNFQARSGREEKII